MGAEEDTAAATAAVGVDACRSATLAAAEYAAAAAATGGACSTPPNAPPPPPSPPAAPPAPSSASLFGDRALGDGGETCPGTPYTAVLPAAGRPSPPPPADPGFQGIPSWNGSIGKEVGREGRVVGIDGATILVWRAMARRITAEQKHGAGALVSSK